MISEWKESFALAVKHRHVVFTVLCGGAWVWIGAMELLKFLGL